jgi:hypothetical protein
VKFHSRARDILNVSTLNLLGFVNEELGQIKWGPDKTNEASHADLLHVLEFVLPGFVKGELEGMKDLMKAKTCKYSGCCLVHRLDIYVPWARNERTLQF